MKKLLVLSLIIIMAFNISSCQTKGDNAESSVSTEQIPTDIVATFDTVEALKIAVKKEPSYYEGKRVSVKGFASELILNNKYVHLYDDLLPDDQKYDGRARIRVIITDSLKLSVIQDGDYVDLNGVVTITTEEVCLTHCAYTMIKTSEEQKSELY